MNFSGLFLLGLAHFLAGRGIISMFRVKEKLLITICMSLIVGTVCFCALPTILEVCHIPITKASVAGIIAVFVAASFGTQAHRLNYSIFKKVPPFRLRLYEIIFICLFIGLMIPSVWRCFYYPPAARDILSGPEPLAEYTVREHKMINSVFSLDLWGTNNQHKPPFIWGLQVIYKLFVHQFGQLWLSILVLSFLTWLYCVLRDKIHPLFVGGIMLYFIAMPDPYGYTYIILYDYSNMILFALAVYYLVRHLMSKEMNLFYFSAFLFGLATLIRSETLIFAGMFYPLLLLVMIKDKVPMPKMAWRAGIFILPSFFFYYAWIGIFLKYYMPGGFELDNQVTTDWANVAPLFTRMKEIITVLLFSKNTNFLYGHIHFVFLVVFVADCVIYRRFDKVRLFFLYAIAVVYIGLPVMGYITPLFDLVNTTKRGMYKIFPIMVFYMANSPLLLKWSGALRSYEQPATKDVVKPQPVAAVNHPSIKNKKTGRATRR